MTDLIGSNYLTADKVPDHVINYKPEPGEYSGMGSDAMLDLKARALIQHARGLGNKDVDSVKRYIDSLDTLKDPSAREIQKKASSYFDRRHMSYEDRVTLDTLLSGGDFLDALATSLGATREETVEYLDEINSRRIGEPGQMKKVPADGYLALPLAKNAAGIYSDRKSPVRRYSFHRQDSAQAEFHNRSYAVSPNALGFLMNPGAAAEELLWHPPNTAVLTPEEQRLQSSKDHASSTIPGGYEAFSPDEFARALSSVKHSLIRGLRKQDPTLTLFQAERLSNNLMIPMLEERSELIRRPSPGVPKRKIDLRSINERFPLDRMDSDQLANVIRVYDGDKNGTFEKTQKKDEKLADMWREAVRAVKQRFESDVYPRQIASANHQAATTRAASKGGDARADIRAAERAGDTEGPEVPIEDPVPQPTESVPEGGPRIVINPEVFEDKRDALCVAMNEAFRVLMEVNGFNPVSEPTEAQRQFFADTAYSQNENQMRRTILARICTFDTSVKDPTNEQLAESAEFLETVMEMGAPQNEWEQQAVQRVHDVLRAALEQGVTSEPGSTEKPPVDEPTGDQRQEQADVGGGAVDEEDTSTLEEREQFLAERGMDTALAETGSMKQLIKMHEEQFESAGSVEPAAQDLSNTNFITLSEEERKKNAQEFINSAQEDQAAQDLSNTNFITLSEEERKKNVQEFINSAREDQAAEPTGPQRDHTGHFRDKDGRVISQRTAQKLWNAEHKQPRDRDEMGTA